MEITKKNGTSTYESKATEKQIYYLVATAQEDAQGVVKAIYGGVVRLEQTLKASFDVSNDSLNIRYKGLNFEEQQAVNVVINEFIESIEAVSNANI